MALKYQTTKSAGCTQSPATQVPLLISLSSYLGYVGTEIWVSVNGANFRDYSKILFGSYTFDTTFYSSNQILF